MMGEVNNNSFDCASLGFVDSHGKSKIKGKWLLYMDFSNGREHVLGAEGEAFAGAFPRGFSHPQAGWVVDVILGNCQHG